MMRAEKVLGDTVEFVQKGFPVDKAMGYIADLSRFDRYQASKGIETAADEVAEWAEAAGLSSVGITKYRADGKRQWWTYRAPVAWTPLEASLSVEGREVTVYPRDPCSIATYSAAVPARTLQLGSELAISPRSHDDLESDVSGFVTDAVSTESQVGRIELAHDSRLFGFSVRPSAMKYLVEGKSARVMVDVDRTGAVPLVTGMIPGKTAEEVWLLAHLCHVRPGANDNLSGVAALLGLASALSVLRPQRTIRFLWGPEFVGTAAALHDAKALPVCALNLDMVGEDQDKCGGPLTIERSPDHVPPFLNALAEAAADAIPPGAWTWRAVPFAGTSDHLLFADRSIARPAVHFGHWPDRFNHSSADTIDKVDPQELARASSIAGATAMAAAGATGMTSDDLAGLVDSWVGERLREAGKDDREDPADGRVVRKWPGPFNLRALLEDAGDMRLRAAREDFVKMTALALAIDDRSSRSRVIRRASFSSRLPIEPEFGNEFLDTLIAAGWAEDGAGG